MNREAMFRRVPTREPFARRAAPKVTTKRLRDADVVVDAADVGAATLRVQPAALPMIVLSPLALPAGVAWTMRSKTKLRSTRGMTAGTSLKASKKWCRPAPMMSSTRISMAAQTN